MSIVKADEQFAGIYDPGDEGTYRHATWPMTERTSKASVYQFGSRWHWKCGPADQPGRCLGGPACTQQEAYEKAAAHICAEHVREGRVHADGACWCGE